MPAIYIVTLLVLIGTDVLPLKVYAGSSGSGDSHDSSKSSGSKGNDDEHHCRKAEPKQEAIEKKIKYLNEKHQPLPTCKCGTSGTISKIDIFNANSGKTITLLTCLGCTGSHVPVTNSTECKNVPDCFRPDLEVFCQIVRSRCRNFTVYRCGSPVTSTPLQATTSVASPPATTQNNPTVITITPTPFRIPGYGDY